MTKYCFIKKNLFKEHWIWKFTRNTKLRKRDFLSEEKISDCSRFWKKVSKEEVTEAMLLSCLAWTRLVLGILCPFPLNLNFEIWQGFRSAHSVRIFYYSTSSCLFKLSMCSFKGLIDGCLYLFYFSCVVCCLSDALLSSIFHFGHKIYSHVAKTFEILQKI